MGQVLGLFGGGVLAAGMAVRAFGRGLGPRLPFPVLDGAAGSLVNPAVLLAATGGVQIPGTAAWADPAVLLAATGNLVPSGISNLALWLRADLGVTVATGVSQWNDQSGAGYNVVQATGSHQPTVNATDAAYNNQATLSFAATSTQKLTNASSLALTQPCTWYIVGQNSASVAGWVDGSMAVYGDAVHHLGLYAGSTDAGTALTSSPSVMCAVFNGASSTGYVNDSTNANPSSGNPGAASMGALTVGGGGPSTNYVTGKIAEILAYEGAHTLSQRQQMFAYLGSRYGLTVT